MDIKKPASGTPEIILTETEVSACRTMGYDEAEQYLASLAFRSDIPYASSHFGEFRTDPVSVETTDGSVTCVHAISEGLSDRDKVKAILSGYGVELNLDPTAVAEGRMQ